MRTLLGMMFVFSTAFAAHAQTPAPPDSARGGTSTEHRASTATGPWHVNFSLMNAFDGNVSHDVQPLRSYGIAPAAAVRYERAGSLAWGYGVALNSYTGTDEWDRVSHGLYLVMTHRAGRVRLETGGDATWKGSSEDRELSNEFGMSERLVFRISDATRVVLSGAYRYKQYPDDPGTSGLSPAVGGKLDQRFGARRVTVGYKFQVRQSRAERDRYRRHAYSVAFSTPIYSPGDELSLEVEYRPQTYDNRLVKVDGIRVPRQDRRFQLAAVYERPISARTNIVWVAGLEKRDSNDPDKRYTAPSLAMTLRYRWR
jgi:hypothetical protein